MLFLVFHPVRLFTMLLGFFMPMLLSFPGLHLTHHQAVVLSVLLFWLMFVPMIDAFIDESRYPGSDALLVMAWVGL